MVKHIRSKRFPIFNICFCILVRLDFTTTSWISKVNQGDKITLTLDNNEFIITGDGSTAEINGYSVTINQWQKVVDGGSITLTSGSNTVKVTNTGGNIKFDGKSLTTYSSMSMSKSSMSGGYKPSSSSEDYVRLTSGKCQISFLIHH